MTDSAITQNYSGVPEAAELREGIVARRGGFEPFGQGRDLANSEKRVVGIRALSTAMVSQRVSRSFWAEASRIDRVAWQEESRTTAAACILGDAEKLSACAKLFGCAARGPRIGRLLRP
jgi:hypothetical protein